MGRKSWKYNAKTAVSLRARSNSQRSARGPRNALRLSLESLEQRLVLNAGPLVISEFMAVNNSIVSDEDGEFSDWVEIYNPTNNPVDLAGYYLTDNSTNLTKWQFPSLPLDSGDYLIVFASNKDRTNPAGTLHTNFKLGGSGEYLGLIRPDATTVAYEFSPQFPNQEADISYGLSADLTAEGYFTLPTPGGPPVADPVSDPGKQIVINELMYHPASEQDAEEYIEVFNRGATATNLAGWQFTSGVDFTFPDITIDPGSYLVIAADTATFSATHPSVTNVIGNWSGQLSNSSESIELVDAAGNRIDRITYADEGDWAVRAVGPVDRGHTGWIWQAEHDGGGKSLELINAQFPNEYGQNWTASATTGGTPGAANSSALANGAPVILDVAHSPILPNPDDPVSITAKVIDEAASGLIVDLFWRIDGAPSFSQSSMSDDGAHGDGVAGDGVYGATLAALPANTVVEFYVQATDVAANGRTWPAPTAPSGQQLTNALYQVFDTAVFDNEAAWDPHNIPVYHSIMTAAERSEFTNINRLSDAQMNATFISVEGTGVELRYNAGVRIRGSGSRFSSVPNNRVNIPADRPWHGVDAININAISFENQVSGSAFHAFADLPTADARPAVYFSNGVNLTPAGGYYALVEPLNKFFADNHFPGDSSGNLYKGRRANESPPGGQGAGLVYFGTDPLPYVSYQKQTNASEADWSDVIALTYALNQTPDETYVQDVEQIVNVDQWLRVLAMHALLDNNEYGLFTGDQQGDDYAMYHPFSDDRFYMIPHDLDTLYVSASRSIFRATNVPALNRLITHPEFLPRYYAQLVDLMDNVFTPSNIDLVLAEAFRGIVSQTRVNQIKSFLSQRVAHVRSIIPDTFAIEPGLPVVNGYPQTTNEYVTLAGNTPAASTQSVMVNGQPGLNAGDGTWDFLPGSTQVLLSSGSSWRYLDNGVDQGTNWRSPTFDDSTWNQGIGQFGFGEGDESTELTAGRTTYYFRSSFDVADPAEVFSLNFRVLRDDGAVVYLNGQELFRSNMPGGTISYGTRASSSVTLDANKFFSYPVSTGQLVAGNNVIAVEVHQRSAGDGHLGFDLQLEGRVVTAETVTLNGGINRLFVQSYDGPGGTGEIVSEGSVDIWYDASPATVISAQTLTGDLTLTAPGGPYQVTGDLVVPAGVTLTIDPGTTVFFDDSASLIVDGGRLLAEGQEYNTIRLTRTPGAAAAWNGVQFLDSMLDNRLSHVVIEYAETDSGSIGLLNSNLTVDSAWLEDTVRRRIRSENSSLIVRNSTFSDVFPLGTPPTTSDLSEQIWGTGIPAGGHLILENNIFGTTTGNNDIIDFTAGNRPDPIPQIINNLFLGGGDEALALSGDAHVEGNVFRQFHKDAFNLDPGEANVIATGADDALTVVRNVFQDVDHVTLIQDNSFLRFENNTVVDVALAAISFDSPGQVTSPGRGAYLDGNIFADVAQIFGFVEPTTELTVNRSIVNATEVGWGIGNLTEAARLNNPDAGDVSLRPGSPALASGPNGLDRGALVPAGTSLSGEPPALTSQTSATLVVAGPGVVEYKYRVNGGPWSPPQPISAPLQLTGLPDGDYAVATIGRNSAGEWQAESEATMSKSWTVNTALSRIVINEVLAINRSAYEHAGSYPDLIELYNAGGTLVTLEGMSVTDDPAVPTKYVIPAGTTLLPGEYLLLFADSTISPGLHTGFSLAGGGEGVYLFDAVAAGGALLDSIVFGTQVADLSIGRTEQGETWSLTQPTPAAVNVPQRLGDARQVVINEWFPSGDVRFVDDFVELYNTDTLPVSLSELYITDNSFWEPLKDPFSPLSFVAAGGFVALDADQSTAADHVDFKLSSYQEDITLLDGGQNVIDKMLYSVQTSDYSQGRDPDAANTLSFYRLPTPGLPNANLSTAAVSVVAIDDSWLFDDSGDDLGAAWREPAFDDSAWTSGAGALGNATGPIPATINTPLSHSAVTYYFRKHFDVSGDPAKLALDLTPLIDDGAVVYVNGTELARIGLDDGEVTSSTFANRIVGNAVFESPLEIPHDLLVAGDNVIAVEVHRSDESCGDIVFGATVDGDQLTSPPDYYSAIELFDGLRISEMMYNSLNGGAEYMEFTNVGPVPLDLTGVQIDRGVTFTFPPLVLEPGAYVVVVDNIAAFQAQYGTWIDVAGQYSGSLSNGGEQIAVQPADPLTAAILRFDYRDSWYLATDGGGLALELADLNVRPDQMSDMASWRAGSKAGGTPGRGPLTVSVDTLLTGDASPRLTGHVTEPDASVDILLAGNSYAATNQGDGSWTLDAGVVTPALADGTYDMIVTATDPDLGSAVDDTVNELTIESAAPAVTVNGLSTSIASPPLSGAVDDPQASILVNIGGVDYAGTNHRDGQWSLPAGIISPLAVNTYTATVTATDPAGNIDFDAAPITITPNLPPMATPDAYAIDEDSLLSVAASLNYRDMILASAPIAYWRLDSPFFACTSENLGSLGAAVDGTYENFLRAGYAVPGLLPNDANEAARFDGVDDRISIPNHAEINDGGSYPERTVELWFQADTLTGRQVLYEEGGGVNGFNIYLDNDQLYVGAYQGNLWGPGGAGVYLNTTVAAGQPYHVAFVFDQPNDLFTGYIDGIAFGSATGMSQPQSSHPGSIAIGATRDTTQLHDGNSNSNAHFFAGVIDEVAIYNTALSNAELLTRIERTRTLLANDTDTDSKPLSITAFDASSALGAVVSVDPNGGFVYDPTAARVLQDLPEGQTVHDTFAYTVSDGAGNTDTGTVTVTVTGAYDPFDAIDDFVTTSKIVPVTIKVLDNDRGGDGRPFEIHQVDATSVQGNLVLNPDGSFAYDPAGQFDSLLPGQTATETFTYAIGESYLKPDTSTYREVDGVVVGEAERFTSRTPASGGQQWLVVPDENIGEGTFLNARNSFLQALPDPGVIAQPTDGPFVDYSIDINTPGDYQLYVRWDGTSNSSNSVYGSIVELTDGGGGTHADWYRYAHSGDGNFATDDWQGDAGFERTNAGGNDVPAIWTILTPGTYTLRFAMREDATALDAWILQLAGSPAPTGSGPPVSILDTATVTVTVTGDTAQVAGRYLLYNNSVFDGNDPASNTADDNAIAPDKSPLFAGGTGAFANYSSRPTGINGIVVDVARLGNAAALSSADFEFRSGNTDDPSSWLMAAAPTSIVVREGAGQGGSDRITLIWADGAIANTWLEVKLLPGGVTGLEEADVFYFGSAVGDSGNSLLNAQVDGFDFAAARDHPTSSAASDNPFDYNRDGRVDGADLAAARDNVTTFVSALKRVSLPATVTPPSAAALVWTDPDPERDDLSKERAERESQSYPRAVDAAVLQLLASGELPFTTQENLAGGSRDPFLTGLRIESLAATRQWDALQEEDGPR